MTLTWEPWKDQLRIQQAERNSPSIHQGESGQPVHLLQASLILNNFDIPRHGINRGVNNNQQDNVYGGQTAAAVRACEKRFNLPTRDTGVAGAEVVSKLDFESALNYTVHAGHFGAALARTDVPLAISKISSSLLGLTFLRARPQALPASLVSLLEDALNVHFRLLPPGSATNGPRRARTTADLDRIINTFTALAGVLNSSGTSFRDGIPVNGIKTAAEADTGSFSVLFGPFYRDFDEGLGPMIGPHSRAAIVIHEGTHAVDTSAPLGQLGRSGQPDVHISEFEGPAYDNQPADASVLNPSSYASFAAHIANNGDPNPRFGLGARSRE